MGTLLLDVVPLPNWPSPLRPQQYATPAVATPHVADGPALSVAKGSPPPTAGHLGA